jgi:large repetitive protein
MGHCRAFAIGLVALCSCGDNIHFGGGTLMVSPQIDLQTTENGGTATFTVALSNAPAGELTVDLTSMDEGEGTVSPATITFDREDYADPRTVTITGVDDDRDDGNQSYTVRVSADYIGAVDLDVTNQDDDVAGFDVSPLLGLMTSESGTQATFEVSLTSQPAADVIVPVASSDDTEGTANKGTLVFNAQNWFTPQVVTVTGQPDTIADGPVSYTIVLGAAMSADNAYFGLDPDDVTLMNIDDDLKGITVSAPASLVTNESGTQATFTVVLDSQPSATVTIPVASSDTTEASVSTAALVFTTANWNVVQTVTVTGVDDFVDDGDQPFTITLGAATSTDTMYAGIDPTDPTGVNVDNDGVSISVQPTTALATNEAGASAGFSVVLGSQPSANVTIAIASSDTTEATVSTTQLVFTPADWNQAQVVTVTGVDDTIDDGDQPFTITIGAAVSSDATYNGIDPADLSGINADDDTASIVVEPTSGLVTSEAGGSDMFSVVLTSQPSGDVTIAIASSDASEGMTLQSSLTFTPGNWNQAQTVTVVGVDDVLADSLQTYTIILSAAVSTDAQYAGMNPADVSVTNLDNDVSGVTVDPISGLVVSEFMDSDTFTIVLDTAPTANVTISLTSSDLTEGTVQPASVTFTPSNWNVPQTVTVTGVNDTIADGNQIFTIITGAAQSTDPTYSGLAVPDVEVTNIDNDTAQVYVKARRRLLVSENGQSATFRVRLTVQPTATVTCTMTSNDTSEGLISPPTLVFQPNDFGFQTVTVSGVDDQIVDGDVLFTILLGACTSTDPQYSGSDPRDVTVINRDND